MECTCRIKSMLDEKQTKIVRDLFALVDKEGPKSKIIALLDGHRVSGCPFSYSWGFEYYCDSQDRINQFLEDRRQDNPK